MNKFLSVIIFLASSVYSDTFPIETDWQLSIYQKDIKNIHDYFLLLPAEFMSVEGDVFGEYKTIEGREKLITKIDIPNGFIEFNRGSQVVLFKDRTLNEDIIGIQLGKCAIGINGRTINSLFQLKDNEWHERFDLLPFSESIDSHYWKQDTVCPYFNLPRYGATVEIINYINGQTIDKIKWQDSKFIYISE